VISIHVKGLGLEPVVASVGYISEAADAPEESMSIARVRRCLLSVLGIAEGSSSSVGSFSS
jgi:hypothetical protein